MKPIIKVIFAISLGVNLLVVGIVIGRVLNGHPPPFTERFSPADSPLGRALMHEQRERFAEKMRKHPMMNRDLSRAERRRAVRDLAVALRADPFDPEAVSKIFAQLQRQSAGMMTAGQEVALTLLQDMSASERRALADRLERKSPR